MSVAGASYFRDWHAVLLRWGLGGLYVYMGLSKAMDPVGFLKVIRQYELVQHHLALNAIAGLLPWFEVFCGVLLLAGILVRGAALISFLMLLPFTWAVIVRAWHMHTGQGLPFCAIRFDCGCGAGEVLICKKVLENTLLMAMSAWLVWRESRRLAVCFELQRTSRGEPCKPGENS